MNQAVQIIDRIAKYLAIFLIHYALYRLVMAGKLDVMYFYTVAGGTLTGMGIHTAVTTPYAKALAATINLQKKDPP